MHQHLLLQYVCIKLNVASSVAADFWGVAMYLLTAVKHPNILNKNNYNILSGFSTVTYSVFKATH